MILRNHLKMPTRLFLLLFLGIKPALGAVQPGELLLDASFVTKSGSSCTPTDPDLDERDKVLRELSCEYHNMSDAFPGTTENLAKLDHWTETARRLQQTGVQPSAQSLLELMEGLWQCQKAGSLSSQVKTSPEIRDTFCDAREQSLVSLSNINWQQARFRYADDLDHDSSHFIDKVAGCYEGTGPLNAQWNSICQVLTPVADGLVDTYTVQEFGIAKNKYFGTEGPILRMFLEKKAIADKIVERLSPRLPALQRQSDAITTDLNSLRDPFYRFVKNPDSPTSSLDDMVSNYKNTYTRTAALVKRYQTWIKGQLVEVKADGTTIDHSLDLVGLPPRLSYEVRLENAAIDFNKPTDGPVSLNQVKSILLNLKQKQQNRNTSAKKLCAVYYCSLAAGLGTQTPYRKACQTPHLTTAAPNPLCSNVGKPLELKNADGSIRATMTPDAYCKDVGFTADNYRKIGLKSSDAAACLKDAGV
ncbi:MAG TPA: hypothetical protein VE954_09250 [Oligoflexus sp.]|uniref:hypothetical protein n=1 Tax=Oligoflexus sp. TaxID=1971216 RepID=UPI002D6624A2|nr:hypothetical protein [Oligoflexus sp.]HYX33287.1 hypothetical protein [Oligoflexus sp.]